MWQHNKCIQLLSGVLIQDPPPSPLHLCNTTSECQRRLQNPQALGPDVLQNATDVQALGKHCLAVLDL